MINKVRTHIERNNMLPEGATVVAAVSGGSDSMAMLHILNMLKGEIGFSLEAIHINHGIRGEEAVITTPDSRVTVCVIPTDEEWMIASDTQALC
jgi:tRNA(Ile)-lysidine synthase TilS/MesJ